MMQKHDGAKAMSSNGGGFDLGDFLDWWTSLSPWVRYPIAILIICGSAWGFVSTARFGGKIWGLGFAIGVILLFLNSSDS